jgi:hypothetical protein
VAVLLPIVNQSLASYAELDERRPICRRSDLENKPAYSPSETIVQAGKKQF